VVRLTSRDFQIEEIESPCPPGEKKPEFFPGKKKPRIFVGEVASGSFLLSLRNLCSDVGGPGDSISST
jgi:hypothetical protein